MIQQLRNHLSNMRAKSENLRWEILKLETRAETIHAEMLHLENLVDKIESNEALRGEVAG